MSEINASIPLQTVVPQQEDLLAKSARVFSLSEMMKQSQRQDQQLQMQQKELTQKDQLERYKAKLEVMGGQAAAVFNKERELRAQGLSDDAIKAEVGSTYKRGIGALAGARYPDGTPMFSEQEISQLPPEPNMGQIGQTLSQLIGAKGMLEQADKHISQQQKAQELALDQSKAKETARHNKAMEGKSAANSFSPEMGDLMGALAERGVSLPAGFRSKEQQATMLKGILDRNPGMDANEIADRIKTGQIEFGAQKKETTTAAGVAGKVEVAQNELQEFIPLVRQASAAVPRGKFVPLNKLTQMADSSISDPNLRALKVRINSVLNAYDMLAARGGTDMEKRREVRSLLMSADSPEAMESALRSFELEAEAARRAAVRATKVPELQDQGAAAPTSGGHPSDPLGLR